MKLVQEHGVSELGTPIMQVTYDDGKVEHLSKLMFEKVADHKPCDATALRDKRVQPIVKIVLGLLKEWGIKTGELPYFGSLINQSLDYNYNQALLKLVGKYMPTPLTLDDVDYLTIDRILKETLDT